MFGEVSVISPMLQGQSQTRKVGFAKKIPPPSRPKFLSGLTFDRGFQSEADSKDGNLMEPLEPGITNSRSGAPPFWDWRGFWLVGSWYGFSGLVGWRNLKDVDEMRPRIGWSDEVWHEEKPWCSNCGTPWKINRKLMGPTAMTHLESKMIWTKPPWGHVPAVNLQGCNGSRKRSFMLLYESYVWWYCWWCGHLSPGKSIWIKRNQLVLATRRYPSKRDSIVFYPLCSWGILKKTPNGSTRISHRLRCSILLWDKSIEKWNKSWGHLLGAFCKTTC